METKVNRPTFQQTVDVLVKAYLNDTLEHRECSACAVGNIIRASGIELTERDDQDTFWLRYINHKIRRGGRSEYDESIALQQINATGYSALELHRIERAFESAECGETDDDHMFNGLMAVVDVLAAIHSIDLSTKEEAKKLFVRA